jgi:hypothetical protein
MKQKPEKVLNAIEKMPEPFKSMGQQLKSIITEEAPHLLVDLWYGSIAFKDPETKKVICFFRLDDQFTLGLGEDAYFDFQASESSAMQPSSWFLVGINKVIEAEIREIIRNATKKI